MQWDKHLATGRGGDTGPGRICGVSPHPHGCRWATSTCFWTASSRLHQGQAWCMSAPCQTRAGISQIRPPLPHCSSAAGLARRLRPLYREELCGLIASHPAGPYKPALEHVLGVLVVPTGKRVSGMGRETVPARTALSGSGSAEA